MLIFVASLITVTTVIKFAFRKSAMLQFENNLAEEPIVLKDGNKIWLEGYKIAIFSFF